MISLTDIRNILSDEDEDEKLFRVAMRRMGGTTTIHNFAAPNTQSESVSKVPVDGIAGAAPILDSQNKTESQDSQNVSNWFQDQADSWIKRTANTVKTAQDSLRDVTSSLVRPIAVAGGAASAITSKAAGLKGLLGKALPLALPALATAGIVRYLRNREPNEPLVLTAVDAIRDVGKSASEVATNVVSNIKDIPTNVSTIGARLGARINDAVKSFIPQRVEVPGTTNYTRPEIDRESNRGGRKTYVPERQQNELAESQ